MRKSRFTEEQIVQVVQEVAREPRAEAQMRALRGLLAKILISAT
jgi:hypothetical protein